MSVIPSHEQTAHVDASGSADSAGLTGLVLRLAEEMAEAWRRGERPAVEDLLERYPELKTQPDSALPLVCEEVCLREEYGQAEAEHTVLNRFPSWRARVEHLLIDHRRRRGTRSGPGFPTAGESWADFHLLAELGRGVMGRVFLATQTALANRPVVLKVGTRDAREHLSLARLQHTHIVPLYTVHDDPARNLRALCMPYFGGASLGQVMEAVRPKPAPARTGMDLLVSLDEIQARSPVAVPTRGPARTLLSKATYPQAICVLGACLAEALKYAHERGLVHLDLKPANVLLAADGQPMLLDFHLARAPLRPGAAPPEWFGGTPKYMSPEQRLATAAVKARRRDFPEVDGRSDIYSLGLVLYEALGGEISFEPVTALPRLECCNARVTTGLADIIHKCLAPNPELRYPDGGALAADLNRYLADQPLVGVANRNIVERWRKWGRRTPAGLARLGTACGILIALVMGINQIRSQVSQHRLAVEEAVATAREQRRLRQFPEALATLSQGLETARGMWWGGRELAELIGGQMQLTQRAQAAHTLRLLADRVRFLFGAAQLPAREMQALEESCRKVWERRGLITGRLVDAGGVATDPGVQTDLLDLALLWTDLRVTLAPEALKDTARREALDVFDEAERLFGAGVVLHHERQRHARALGRLETPAPASMVPRTAWEHFALGRALLNAGNTAVAAAALDRAVALQPAGFWPNFYQGVAAFRLKQFAKAAQAFCACVALRPESAECYHNRALARRELDDLERALADYDRALELTPRLGGAALNRGILHLQAKRFPQALADLERALRDGADATAAHYHLAWVHHEQGETAAALAHLDVALRHTPGHKDALALAELLRQAR